jgi:RimJ/RimL family protein N-acetyltransferase
MKDKVRNVHVGIRRFQPDDAAALYAAARESIKELCGWMSWCDPGYSYEDASAFIEKCPTQWDQGVRYSFAIYSQEGWDLLGSVGLSAVNPTHQFANLGYWVRTGQTGKGVGTAAARLAARFAFEKLGLNRLEIIIPMGNRASIRVAEKLGAHFEGILRRRYMLRGKPCDALGYSLLASEYRRPVTP